MQNFLTAQISLRRLSVKGIVLAFPLVYALTLAFLPIEKYTDRDNYLAYVTSSPLLLGGYWGSGISTLLQNEPIWLSINLLLGLFFENDVVLRILIFVSSFLFSFSVLRIGKPEPRYVLYAVAICLLPQIMKNYVIHLRQGLAISVFVFSMLAVAKIPRLAGLAATPFVHSSFFFVQMNMILTWLMNEGIRRRGNIRAALLIAMAAVCVASLAAVWTIDFFGARQIEEYENLEFLQRSGMGFVFWLIVLLIFMSNNRKFKVTHFFSIASILGYITLYFSFSPVARVFESAMPIVLISGYDLRRGRLLFFCLLGALFVFQWLGPVMTGGEVFRLAE